MAQISLMVHFPVIGKLLFLTIGQNGGKNFGKILMNNFTVAGCKYIVCAALFMKSKGITWPLFYTGVFYLAFVGLLTLLFSFIERKLSYFK